MSSPTHPPSVGRRRCSRPPFVFLAATLALALLAAACGSDASDEAVASTTVSVVADDGGDAGSSTTSTTAGTTSTTAEDTTTTDGASTSTTAVGTSTSDAMGDDTPELALAVAPDGLLVVQTSTGSTTPLTFGADQSTVLTAMTNVLGPPDQENQGNVECNNGQAAVARWDDDIVVDFDADGGFLSWQLLAGSELTDLTGVGLGSTLADVSATWDATVEESTLGIEFSVGDGESGYLGGLLDGEGSSALVEELWGGQICTFR